MESRWKADNLKLSNGGRANKGSTAFRSLANRGDQQRGSHNNVEVNTMGRCGDDNSQRDVRAAVRGMRKGSISQLPKSLSSRLSTTCGICQRVLCNKHNLESHMATHDPNRSKFECPRCFKFYFYKQNFKRHLVQLHSMRPEDAKNIIALGQSDVGAGMIIDLVNDNTSNSKDDEVLVSTGLQRPYIPRCRYTVKGAEVPHASAAKKVNSPSTGIPSSAEAVTSGIRVPLKVTLRRVGSVLTPAKQVKKPFNAISVQRIGRHKCPHCPKKFKTLLQLRRHKLNAHRYNKLKCPLCPFKSLRRSQMQDHLQLHNFSGNVSSRGTSSSINNSTNSSSAALHNSTLSNGNPPLLPPNFQNATVSTNSSSSNATRNQGDFQNAMMGFVSHMAQLLQYLPGIIGGQMIPFQSSIPGMHPAVGGRRQYMRDLLRARDQVRGFSRQSVSVLEDVKPCVPLVIEIADDENCD